MVTVVVVIESFQKYQTYRLWLELEPYKESTFDFTQKLVKTPPGDFKQVSEEF